MMKPWSAPTIVSKPVNAAIDQSVKVLLSPAHSPDTHHHSSYPRWLWIVTALACGMGGWFCLYVLVLFCVHDGRLLLSLVFMVLGLFLLTLMLFSVHAFVYGDRAF
jgi:hypothetical protein